MKFRKPKLAKPSLKLTKRKIIGLVAIAAVVTALVLILTLGSSGTSLQTTAMRNVSEARFFMKQSYCHHLRIQFFSGIREAEYTMDGRPTRTTPFAILNVEPTDNTHFHTQELKGVLRIDNEEKEVTLTRNRHGRNFAIDLGRTIDQTSKIEFSLHQEGQPNTYFELEQVLPSNAISWEQALKIAVEAKSSELNAAASFEVYVKIITDRANANSFWYVQFLTNDMTTHFAVISPRGQLIGNSAVSVHCCSKPSCCTSTTTQCTQDQNCGSQQCCR